MTRKEELIQAIQQSPEEVVSVLWETLQQLQPSLRETRNTQDDSEGFKGSQWLHRNYDDEENVVGAIALWCGDCV